ncbi:MAG: hypothetical protein NZ480_04760 [Bdellovibrionaceae bacterium]|nr:hypothetical protein [Pseudobdellovibrionaceae bacterium]MDW8190835.1 hypothetical protein [Pseudobdellovibrionaceae bacterium]
MTIIEKIKGSFQVFLFLFVFGVSALLHTSCKLGDYSGQKPPSALDYFSKSCQSAGGSWSQQALQQNQMLVATLEQVKQAHKNDCQGLDTLIRHLQNLNDQLYQAAHHRSFNAYRTTQQVHAELLLELLSISQQPQVDAQYLNSLRNAIYQKQLDLVTLRAQDTVWEQHRNRLSTLDTLRVLNNSLLSVLSQGNLSACFRSAPYASFAIASSLLSMAGRFASPILGATLGEIGQLMATSILHLKSQPLDESIMRLYGTQLQSSISCAFESISNLYCDADATRRLVQQSLKTVRQSSQQITAKERRNQLWYGVELMNRHISIFYKWLEMVIAGSEPSDEFTAQKIINAWKKYDDLKMVKIKVTGLINTTRKELDSISDERERELLTKSRFKNLVATIYVMGSSSHGGTSFSPIAEYYGFHPLICFLATGELNGGCLPPTSNPSFIDLSIIDSITHILNGWVGIEARLSEVLTSVEAPILKNLARTINQDPSLIITSALQKQLDGTSPFQVAKEIRMFLNDMRKRFETNPDLQSAPQLQMRWLNLIDTSQFAFDQLINAIETTESPEQVIKTAFDHFRLQEGITFIHRRLTQLIEFDVTLRLRQESPHNDIFQDFITSGRTILDYFSAINMNIFRDADSLYADLNNAQYISRNNLFEVVTTFGPTLNQLLKQIKQEAERFGETSWDQPAHQRLAHLCIFILSATPKWPSDIDKAVCANTLLASAYDENKVLRFRDLERAIAKGLAEPQRICAYQNFIRSSKASQIIQSSQFMNMNSVTHRSREEGNVIMVTD